MGKIFWIDTETTGLDHKVNSIIDFGGIVEIDGNIRDHIVTKPKCFEVIDLENHRDDISDEALDKNNTTREELAERTLTQNAFVQMLKSDMRRYVNPYQKKDKFVIAGYNVDFDVKFLRSAFERCGDKFFGSWFFWPVIDVKCMVATEIVGGLRLKDYKLETVSNHYGVTFKAHEASTDIKATRDLCNILIEKNLSKM